MFRERSSDRLRTRPAAAGLRPSPDESQRLSGLDASRGLAMLLVCLSHFAEVYLDGPGDGQALRRVTLAATPSFVLTSGVVLGFLHGRHFARFERIRRKLIDRALFLLTVAHVLIAATHLPLKGLHETLATVFVTDTLAACVLLGTAIVPATQTRARLPLALAIYGLASVLVFAWQPSSVLPLLLKHLLVGCRPGELSPLAYGFPLLQWFAVYLGATALGERAGRGQVAVWGALPLRLCGCGAALAAVGLLLRAARPLFTSATAPPGLVRFLTDSGEKSAPGTTYLALYLGSALCVLAAGLWLAKVGPGSIALRTAAVVGRNSLFVFVLQYAVYYGVVPEVRSIEVAWPILFAATILAVLCAVWLWNALGGHRALTLGFPGLVAAIERTAAARRA